MTNVNSLLLGVPFSKSFLSDSAYITGLTVNLLQV
jgi:hypothetical protein